MNSRRARLALAYTLSIALNGAFWLAYSHELRTRAKATVLPHPAASEPAASAVDKLDPLSVGIFKPLPPLPAAKKPAPVGHVGKIAAAKPASAEAKSATDADRLDKGDAAVDTAAGAANAAAVAAVEKAASRATRLAAAAQQAQAGADAAAAEAARAAQAAESAAAQAAAADRQLDAARQALADLAPDAPADKSAAVNAAEKAAAAAHGTAEQAQAALAAARDTAVGATDLATAAASVAQAAQGEAQHLLAGLVSGSQVKVAMAAPVHLPARIANLPTRAADAADAHADSDRDSGADHGSAERKRNQAEDKKRQKPSSKVTLKMVKMWSPRPGQQFNLATNLNIVFPKDLKVVPGTQSVELTDEQLAQIMALMAHQHLEQVTMDKSQIRHLAEMRRQATTHPHHDGKDNKDADAGGAAADERRREAMRRAAAKRQQEARAPKPAPKDTETAALQRPRSPFVVKMWDSDMYHRWAPRPVQIAEATPPATARPDADTAAPQTTPPKGAPRVAATGAPAPGTNGGPATGGNGTPAPAPTIAQTGGPAAGNALGGTPAGPAGGAPAGGAPGKAASGTGAVDGGQPGNAAGAGGGGQPGNAAGAGGGGQPGNAAGAVGGGQPGTAAGAGGQGGTQPGAAAGAAGGGQGGNRPGGAAGAAGGGGNQPGGAAGAAGGGGQQSGGAAGGGNHPGGAAGAAGGGGQGGNQPGGAAGAAGGGGQGGSQPGGAAGAGGGQGGNQAGNAGAAAGAAGAGGAGSGSGGMGEGAGGGALGGEQSDGLDPNAGAGESAGDNGFVARESYESPELPPDPPGTGHTVPGALVLPPSPPLGTETGRDVTPHQVHAVMISVPSPGRQVSPPRRRTRAEVQIAHSATHAVPAAPLPVGEPDKHGPTPIPLALTVGSTSRAGNVPMTVLPGRLHLSLGTPTDQVDPIQPPAEGTPESLSLVPRRKAALGQTETRSVSTSAAPRAVAGAGRKPAPSILLLAHNSEGVKEGTEQPLPATPLPDSDMEIGDGSGLKGDYYQGPRFDQYQFSRADPEVNFDWMQQPTQSPGPKIPSQTDYTVRWTGRIAARYSETYRFYAAADDGVRVWINHKLVIDAWSAHSLTQFSNTFTFKAGEQYVFKCEYLEIDGGGASVFLYWESPHTPKQFVPEDAFFYPLPSDEDELQKDKATY